MRNSQGFTLIEIIVAVALVAILSAAVAPSVLNNISMGRVTRAQSDVQALASAVMRFKSDTGKYPRLDKPGESEDTVGAATYFLATDGPDAEFPTPSTNGIWPTAFKLGANKTAATCQSITNHLIYGVGDEGVVSADSYPRAVKPDDPASTGFRQGYISADQLDPWGHKYLINVGALGLSGQPVWVISAGPDGRLETAITTNATGAAPTAAGDDIGFRIQ